MKEDLQSAGSIPIEMVHRVRCGAFSSKVKIDREKWDDIVDKFDQNKQFTSTQDSSDINSVPSMPSKVKLSMTSANEC